MKFGQANVSQRLLILLTTGLVAMAAARAQDAPPQTPDLQQMQRRLEQLENEVQQLRQQMNAAAAQQSKAAAAELNSKPVAPDLKAAASVPAQAPTAAEQPAKTRTTAENTVDFYGYVMMDSGYNFGTIDPNWFDVVRPTKLNSFPGEFGPNGNTYFGVRQTRFGVKSFTPTPLGDLKTQFEFELFGTGVDAGQTTFRLRHAYGELGHFGAGQYWSPFMDIDVFPNSIEYWGPNGMVFFRNVQARWMPIQGDSNVVIALERPGASADQGIYSNRIELQGVVPQFKWPDLSGHGRLARKWGYVQVGALVRKIAWVDTNQDKFNLSGTAIGWGVNTSSNLNLGKKDVAKLQVVYGAGIQNYMNDAPFDVGVKNNISNPISPIKGVPLPVLGVVSFLDHTWSTKYTSSAGYSFMNIENSNAETPSDFHQGHYALANLLYHPMKRVTMGSEFQFGRRVNFKDGFNVNDYRMQFSFRYDWNKGFSF
jgi:hypothetical protein